MEMYEGLQIFNGPVLPETSATIRNGAANPNTKTKRTRRKPRKKNPKVVEPEKADDYLTETLANFKITAITNQTSGRAFRIKKIRRHVCDKSKLKPSEINDLGHKVPSKFPVEDQNGRTSTTNRSQTDDNKPLQSRVEASTASTSGSPSQKKKKKQKKEYPFHYTLKQVNEGLQSGELIKGTIRINVRNSQEAYVGNEDRSQQDYLVPDVLARNRALEGDLVVIQLKPETEWSEKQKTAIVVYILEKVHSRTAVGFLHAMLHSKKCMSFVPRDRRFPRLQIPRSSCPQFLLNNDCYKEVLFKAQMKSWINIKFGEGVILEHIGVKDNLEIESYALLAENDLDISEFPSNFLKCVLFDDVIPSDEFKFREDLRSRCIFTIDPSTARDLDDAVSCRELQNGNLEIGVHISDVAYFLTEGTPLDKMVKKKATTIYLVDKVFHMLPEELCMRCSLLPGVDKRAFSVFWEVTKTGDIVSHRFSRTVIRSCVKLSYDHAQQMIENPNRKFGDDELPQIHNGFASNYLSKVVNCLQGIAVKLRARRFEQGALRIDQTKLLFKLDEETGKPVEFFVYENKEAHRLIEEFMLLANTTVAKKIKDCYPNLAFLRCHDPPTSRLLKQVQSNLSHLNIDLDISSSKGLQDSVNEIRDNKVLDDGGLLALYYLLAKPMTRARYFCAGDVDDESGYKHYALHIPIYTHFTSPIRRYADIMVHRLLAACLGYSPNLQWNVNYVSKIATTCNRQKYNAKCAGDACSDLYLIHYIGSQSKFICSAVVVHVKNTSFDALVVETGSIIRIFFKLLKEGFSIFQLPNDNRNVFMVTLLETSEFPEHCYVIDLFAVVKVDLKRRKTTNKLDANLVHPMCE